MGLVVHAVCTGPNPDRLFLLVHGKGADERDLEPLLPHLDRTGRFRVVLPRAPISFPPGFMWYATDGLPRGGPEFVPSLEALDDLLDTACAEGGFDRREAIVGGFSQGAALVLALGLRRSPRPRPAGVLAMSGFLPGPPGVDYDLASAPPVLLQHGRADPLISVDFGRRAARTLEDAGAPLVYREYPTGHQVVVESMADASAWLTRVLAGERPSEPVTVNL